MSIYRTLNFDRPVIQYSIIHQSGRDVLLRDYTKNMLEMHRSVQQESRSITTQWEQAMRDASERSVQAIRGSLMQFLTTPLQSDAEEIRGLVREQFRSVVSAVLPFGTLGPMNSTEGRFHVDPLKTGPLKQVTSGGRKYLEELGFKSTKASPPVFESTFRVDGGVNLDVLEHIVRDRMGIYASLHGKHIREAASMTFAAHNLIYQRSDSDVHKGVEAVLFFSKGPVKYDGFRQSLFAALDGIWQGHKPDAISVWQRKLGLGKGREFQLRIQAPGRGAATEVVDRLLRSDVGPEAIDALKKGQLLYKEILAYTEA